MKDNFPRGSEWRRWDLHLHTASSYDSAYKADNADEVLCQALRNNEVAVVAITDHFIIDKHRIESLRKLAPDIVFFPGVELRTDKGDTNIHVILIFSSEINLDNLAGDFDTFKRTKAKSADDYEAIFWDYNAIVEFAKGHDAIISIHAGSKTNGLDDRITTNTLAHTTAVKEDYAETVHIFEMGKEKDVDGYNQHVFQIISRKPMIICSDNHDPRQYNPKSKLWIKADPTFEGLKQILYEPEERVRISDTQPETKQGYHVIESITFNDPDFPSEKIVFNDKLTCIIGGKSTGKTILLHNLAFAIDSKQVEAKDEKAQVKTKKDVPLTVSWKDGDNSAERNVVYIPQTYLNRLCDQETEKTEIDNIIQDIVLLNDDAKKAFESMTMEIKNYKTSLDKKIVDLLETHNSIVWLEQQMKELGNKKGIEAEKEKLEIERKRLSKELAISEDTTNEYEYASKNITDLSIEIIAIQQDIGSLNTMNSLVESKHIANPFTSQTKARIDVIQKEILGKADLWWKEKKEALIASLASVMQEKKESLKRFQAKEAELKDKIVSSKAISELTNKISEESKKLAKFFQYDEDKKKKNHMKNYLITEIADSIVFYKKQREHFAQSVIKNCQNITPSDMQISVDVPFRKEVFVEKMGGIMDKGTGGFRKTFDNFDERKYTFEFVKDVVQGILSANLRLKVGNTFESTLRELFNDWYEVKYKVKMGNDLLEVMSPGKKALVLLKLLIELAESKCPILIDQPEDDLDNRSIFDDLIPFIKKKKKERQIIVVTHNANVVVGADAEEVIIANQHADNSPNKQHQFEYRSGAIENDTCFEKENGNETQGILNERGIQQHICDILEGGEKAFELRKNKYHL